MYLDKSNHSVSYSLLSWMCVCQIDKNTYETFTYLFRGKSLENQLRVGCFKRDVSVQTDVSELPSLQTLGENNSTLRMVSQLLLQNVHKTLQSQ